MKEAIHPEELLVHRSRLTSILIDCDERNFDESVAFWSAALDKQSVPESGAQPRYVSLRGRVGGEGGPYVSLQRTSAEERGVHVDIESDDVEAEVQRLEALGAKVRARISKHVVMLAQARRDLSLFRAAHVG